jgi:hypothetical protein
VPKTLNYLVFQSLDFERTEKSFEVKIPVKISFPCEFVASYGNKM